MRSFLNVELPKLQARRVDLVLLLEDGSIVHIEIQSGNDALIPYRMMGYYALLKEMYRRPVRQVLLYVGNKPLTMPDRLEEDGNRLVYQVLDMHDFDAQAMMATGNPADLALAVLAGGGGTRLPEILRKAARLKGTARGRLLAQILLLAGLRGLAGKVEWELRRIGVVIDVTKNPVLMRWQREFIIAQGKS